jgi:hypothetical protein
VTSTTAFLTATMPSPTLLDNDSVSQTQPHIAE